MVERVGAERRCRAARGGCWCCTARPACRRPRRSASAAACARAQRGARVVGADADDDRARSATRSPLRSVVVVEQLDREADVREVVGDRVAGAGDVADRPGRQRAASAAPGAACAGCSTTCMRDVRVVDDVLAERPARARRPRSPGATSTAAAPGRRRDRRSAPSVSSPARAERDRRPGRLGAPAGGQRAATTSPRRPSRAGAHAQRRRARPCRSGTAPPARAGVTVAGGTIRNGRVALAVHRIGPRVDDRHRQADRARRRAQLDVDRERRRALAARRPAA